MTRGNMVLILSDDEGNRKYCRSGEFNGDMYTDNGGYGAEIIEKYQSGEIENEDDFASYVREFNKNNHNYEEDMYIGEVKLEEWNGECRYIQYYCGECPYSWIEGKGNKTCTYSMDFHGVSNLYDISSYPYHHDYSYWLNLSGEDIEVLASNGVVKIKNGGGAVFNYSEFVETELDSELIDAEDSYDFEDEAFVIELKDKYNLTKDEAQELKNDTDIREIDDLFESVSAYGYSLLERYGVDDWIIPYVDTEQFGYDQVNADGVLLLGSGRVVTYSE